MGYKVTCPEDKSVSVLKLLAVLRDPNTGEWLGNDHYTQQHFNGDVIPDEELSPVLRDLYEDGDSHVRSLFEYVEEEGVSSKDEKKSEEEPQNPVVAQAERNAKQKEALAKARAAKAQKAQANDDEE